MIEIRCPQCNKLLGKTEAPGPRIEIVCPKCKVLVAWPSLRAEIVTPDPDREREHPSRLFPSS